MFIIIWLVLHFLVETPEWVLAIAAIAAAFEAIGWLITLSTLVYSIIKYKKFKIMYSEYGMEQVNKALRGIK